MSISLTKVGVVVGVANYDCIQGHGRSTSWDLTKLLKEGSLGGIVYYNLIAY